MEEGRRKQEGGRRIDDEGRPKEEGERGKVYGGTTKEEGGTRNVEGGRREGEGVRSTEKRRRCLGGKNSAQERQKMFVCPTILQIKREMALQKTANQLSCPTKTHTHRRNWREREEDTSYIDMARYISSHPDIWRDKYLYKIAF